MEFIFGHADKRRSFCKLLLFFLMEMAIHVQNTQNRFLLIFLQYIKKIVARALCSIAGLSINSMRLHLHVPTYGSIYLGVPLSHMQNFIYDESITHQHFSQKAQLSFCK